MVAVILSAGLWVANRIDKSDCKQCPYHQQCVERMAKDWPTICEENSRPYSNHFNSTTI